jgi:DNA-binding FrmR family transcriptional regulator
MEQLPADETHELLTRLHRIEGQVRGVQKMLEEGRSCAELLVQLSAAVAGLRKVGGLAYAAEVQRLLASAEARSEETRAALEALTDRFAGFA